MRRSLKHWLRRLRKPWLKTFYASFDAYLADDMEAGRRVFSYLPAGSTVFDIGGFEGNWAAEMHERYGCKIHIFEPHPRFADQIKARFAGNSDITVHDFALGSENGDLLLGDDGDASSSLAGRSHGIKGRVVAVRDFFADFGGQEIALAKINIEGGEYDLIPALMDAERLEQIRTYQVQFHLFSEAHLAERGQIVEKLEVSHASDWSYPFVWEQWTRRSAG